MKDREKNIEDARNNPNKKDDKVDYLNKMYGKNRKFKY